MTHVLFVTPWYPTPAEPVGGAFVREQAQALAGAGHRVGVLVAVPRDTDWRDETSDVLALFTGVRDAPALGSSLEAIGAARRLFARYVQQRGRPDLIHAHVALPAGVAAMMLGRRERLPFVLTEHASVHARGLLRPWHGPLLSRVFGAAAERVAVSPSLAALLTERHGRRGAWTVIGNVVDEGFFQPGEPAPAPDGPFRFLAIGSLDENKAHADLLRAFARAFSGEAGTTLRIGGAGPQRTALEALAGALGVASRVSFLGTLSRDGVRAEMQRAGAVILPSRYETFGVVLIEALACGVPVVATRCGGPESIVTEQNGILVPARDPEALATALSRMRAEAGRHDRAAIRADCVARFGRAAFTSAAGALYERVLATRR